MANQAASVVPFGRKQTHVETPRELQAFNPDSRFPPYPFYSVAKALKAAELQSIALSPFHSRVVPQRTFTPIRWMYILTLDTRVQSRSSHLPPGNLIALLLQFLWRDARICLHYQLHRHKSRRNRQQEQERRVSRDRSERGGAFKERGLVNEKSRDLLRWGGTAVWDCRGLRRWTQCGACGLSQLVWAELCGRSTGARAAVMIWSVHASHCCLESPSNQVQRLSSAIKRLLNREDGFIEQNSRG